MIVKRFNIDKLVDLPEFDQFKIAILLNSVPRRLLSEVSSIDLFKNTYSNTKVLDLNKEIEKKLSINIIKNINYNILVNFFQNNKRREDLIPRLNSLAKAKNYNAIANTLYFYSMLNGKDEYIYWAYDLSYQFIYEFLQEFRYDLNVNLQSHYFNLWKKRSKNKVIENISIKKDKYQIEIVDNENPIGLVLGIATDCCQIYKDGSTGSSCVYSGTVHSESFFVQVTKKNTVYAQSWCWIGTHVVTGEKVFCFDSIEMLSTNLDQAKEILSLYKELAEKLVAEKGVDMVIAGNDGNCFPSEEMNKYEIVYDYDLYSHSFEEEEFNEKSKMRQIYTDTIDSVNNNHKGQILLAGTKV
jgi:hypothetical protein